MKLKPTWHVWWIVLPTIILASLSTSWLISSLGVANPYEHPSFPGLVLGFVSTYSFFRIYSDLVVWLVRWYFQSMSADREVGG
jgi:hypothetical protein